MGMKLQEVEVVKVGENKFGIRRFGAFKAANMSGELVAIFAPILAALVPSLVDEVKAEKKSGSEKSLLDSDVDELVPTIVGAFKTLKGDSVEVLLKKLLIDDKNISVKTEEYPEGEILTNDLADEIFCGEVQDMFILAAKVIMLNYQGFFRKLQSPSGQGAAKAVAKQILMTA